MLEKEGIDRKLRGETLTLENFKAITDQVALFLEEKGHRPGKGVEELMPPVKKILKYLESLGEECSLPILGDGCAPDCKWGTCRG